MFWTFALDVLMAALLAASIATTVILNRRLTGLRGDNAELEKLTRSFQEATDRADHGVSGLKVSAQSLQERMDQARAWWTTCSFSSSAAAVSPTGWRMVCVPSNAATREPSLHRPAWAWSQCGVALLVRLANRVPPPNCT